MVSASQTFKMYEMVNKYLKNNEDAKAIVIGIEGIIDERLVAAKETLATKQDIIEVKADLVATKAEILTRTRTDLITEISRLETRMEQGFKDQLKWIIMLMFGFSSLIIALIKLT